MEAAHAEQEPPRMFLNLCPKTQKALQSWILRSSGFSLVVPQKRKKKRAPEKKEDLPAKCWAHSSKIAI